jgi:hypothetical protein
MRRMRTVQLTLLLVALISGAATASAQPTAAAPGAEAVAKADALFREGVRFVAQQKWAEAEAKFLAAWALNPSYDVATNLGQAQYRLGKYRDAAEHLAFALRNWPIIGKREPRDLAQQRLAEVRKQVGAVTIRVSRPGAEVFVDGQPVGRSPIEHEVFVEPGARSIEAKLAGYEDAQQRIEASKGGELSVMLTLAASAVTTTGPGGMATATPSGRAAPGLPSPPPPSVARPIWPVAVGAGAALVFLGGGIGFTVAANTRMGDAAALREQVGGRSACTGKPNGSLLQTCAELHSALADRDTLSNVAMVSFLAGGALVLGTVGMGVWAWSTKPGVRMEAAPVMGAHRGGIVVTGSW